MKESCDDVKKLFRQLDEPVKVAVNFLSQPDILAQPSILPYRVMLARVLQVQSIDNKQAFLSQSGHSMGR